MRAAILLALACTHARPPSPIENAPGAPLATSARGLHPGEAITWSVQTLGGEVGEVAIAVGVPGTLDGHTAVKVRRLGSETVHVPLGTFPALRIDGVADDGALHADFSLWLTDDSDRVPVRVVLRSDVLTATFEVTSYQQ